MRKNMSSNNKSRRWKNNKKSTNRGNKKKDKPAKIPVPARPSISLKPLVREVADCPICGEPIKDITSALSLKGEDGTALAVPAHFDCVLDQIKEKETLGPDETIIYLGKGEFGVVIDKEYLKGKLQIIRKIGYEQLDNRDDWRQNMRLDVDFQKN
jgi:hypothetical protein